MKSSIPDWILDTIVSGRLNNNNLFWYKFLNLKLFFSNWTILYIKYINIYLIIIDKTNKKLLYINRLWSILLNWKVLFILIIILILNKIKIIIITIINDKKL